MLLINNIISIEEIRNIPVRTKIVRINKSNKCSIVFIKEGSNSAFAITFPNEPIKIIQSNYVLEYFKLMLKKNLIHIMMILIIDLLI